MINHFLSQVGSSEAVFNVQNGSISDLDSNLMPTVGGSVSGPESALIPVETHSLFDDLKVEVSEQLRERLSFIDNFDYSPIRMRLHDKLSWTIKQIAEVEFETKKFFALTALTHGEYDFSISPECDEFWHALILHTNLYREFCNGAFGHFLDHLPGLGTEADRANLASDYTRTVEALQQYFTCDSRYWPAELQCCKRCSCRNGG